MGIAPSSPPPPPDIDVTRPAAARVYDYYLGGAHNFEIDRDFGRRMEETLPLVKQCAQANRGFLRRVVKWLCQQGVDQFLDIGSGVPTAGNVHEIAQEHNPKARTIYVDYEHVAASHSGIILDEQDPQRRHTDALKEDFRAPSTILDAEPTRQMLDFDEPVGLLLVALMPFVGPGDDPMELMRQYRDRLPSGSYVAMTQITSEGVPEDMIGEVEHFAASYANTANPVFLRDHASFEELFTGFDLLRPGVVWAPEWLPEDPPQDPSRTVFMAGVGRKP